MSENPPCPNCGSSLDYHEGKCNVCCYSLASALLLAAVKRLVAANEALGEMSENRLTYYEESPTKNAECHRRWVELSGALTAAREAVGSNRMVRRGEIMFPRPCCSCGAIVEKRSTGAVACAHCMANWDSFLGICGGAFMDREQADAIAANNDSTTP